MDDAPIVQPSSVPTVLSETLQMTSLKERQELDENFKNFFAEEDAKAASATVNSECACCG